MIYLFRRLLHFSLASNTSKLDTSLICKDHIFLILKCLILILQALLILCLFYLVNKARLYCLLKRAIVVSFEDLVNSTRRDLGFLLARSITNCLSNPEAGVRARC
jgi:hypothetical protein